MAAWRGALILSIGLQNVDQANETGRRVFLERYKQHLFPNPGSCNAQTVWKTRRSITRVTIWGREHFRNNVRLAMVTEALRLGPQYYCVMRTNARGFSERVYLLAQFLPHQKICIYPDFGLPLRGLFSSTLHTTGIGNAITNRRIPLEQRPNVCFHCETCFCDHVMEDIVDL